MTFLLLQNTKEDTAVLPLLLKSMVTQTSNINMFGNRESKSEI